MQESVIIYAALFAGFILLLLFIRLYPFSHKSKDDTILMYYMLELPDKKVTTITASHFEQHCKLLNSKGYELVFLSDLEEFASSLSKLPANSFLIALNESYSSILKTSLPALLKNNIHIIIFIPIIVVQGDNNRKEAQVQQLNEFIFSDEFKNIFSYTQPIC